MTLVTDSNNEVQRMYPNSYIWQRDTFLGFDLLSFSYHSIQILDGKGNPLEPAYSDWLKTSKTNYITGLRDDSLNDRQVC